MSLGRQGIAARLLFSSEDRQFLECLPNPRASRPSALNHERGGRLGCLVRVAGIEGRGGVVLDPELDGFCDLWPGKLGHDAECEVDSRRDTARCEDIAVAHDALLFVTGADQGQQVDLGPMRRRPTPLQQPGRTKKKGASAHRGYVLCLFTLAANEVDRLGIREGIHNAEAASGHADQVERWRAVEGARRHDAQTAVA